MKASERPKVNVKVELSYGLVKNFIILLEKCEDVLFGPYIIMFFCLVLNADDTGYGCVCSDPFVSQRLYTALLGIAAFVPCLLF